MIARKRWMAPGAAAVLLAAALFLPACNAAGGGGGGAGETVPPERLEANDALRAVCGDMSDAEIEGILDTIAGYWEQGQSSGEAGAQSALICAVNPPGG